MLQKNSLKKYTEYIHSLNLSKEISRQLLDNTLIDKNPDFYLYYPYLFSNTFTIKSDKLNLLNISGFLYYQSTLYLDKLIDEKDLTKIPLITICQEESIKILTSIYGLKDNFWIFWNNRKNDYFEAIYIEKNLSKKEIVLIDEYENLADKKSAFGKLAIDCLFCIDEIDRSIYQNLLLSHKYFSIAFQLNDDLLDFKEDYKSGQFNWAIYLLKQQNISNDNLEHLHKYLYIKGVSKAIYKLAIEYCNKSLNIIEDINIPQWKEVLKSTKKSLIISSIEIDNYLEILSAEINLSNGKKTKNNINNSIKTAIAYIKNTQKKDGSWHEYINQGGISNIWATAFILSKISECFQLKSIFKLEISKALKFIKKNKSSKLWSYNTTWIEDADSSNFVFLSLLLNDKKIKYSSFVKWSKYQKKTGGFSTYSNEKVLIESLNDKKISNVNGWLSAHDCVSAVSFYFLANFDKTSNEFFNVKKYFDIKNITDINSYWWTSKIYSYYYLAKTYHFLNEVDKLNSIISIIESKQNDNGSFSDEYGENLFFTALSLEIMILSKSKNLIDKIEKAVLFLINNQFIDGSWENSHALQIPKTSDLNLKKTNYPIKTFGTDVRAKEFNRLFTTTSVLKSLVIYEQKNNTNNL